MPIKGLTDRTPGFKEIGRLRLGISKAEMKKNKGAPQELPYFRADFRPDSQVQARDFNEAYGAEPTAINFRLPFDDIVRCWDANYECYTKNGLVAMADGEQYTYLRDPHTGQTKVKNGSPYIAFDPRVPVYSYKNSKGDDVAVYAAPTGRLKMIIPELHVACYVLLVTHSKYNIIKFSEQLLGIVALGQNVNYRLPMIPLVLSRRKEQISVNIDGKKAYQEKYLCNLEISPAWMGAAWKQLDALLPGVGDTRPLALPIATTPEIDLTPEDVSEFPVDSDADDEEEFFPEDPDWPEPSDEAPNVPVPALAKVAPGQMSMPIDPEPKKAAAARLWPGAFVQAILQAGLADTSYSAVGALNKSNLSPTEAVDAVLAWMRLYRGHRDSGLDSDTAAEKANSGELCQ